MRKFLLLFLSIGSLAPALASQPNILWIVTDDHRADSIRAFNRAESQRDHSALGFVSSPAADQLAKEGVLFTRAYCNSPGCAPSRTSMHYGMYPHRSGHFGFENSHRALPVSQKTLPELMKDLGYTTAHFGKDGLRIFNYDPQKLQKAFLYDFSISQKELYQHDRTDWSKRGVWADGKNQGDEFFWNLPGKPARYLLPKDGQASEEVLSEKRRVEKKLDLLYSYERANPNLVVGGVSPCATANTQDGQISSAFRSYLAHADESYQAPWKQKQQGPPSDKPLFAALCHHFPHTPVLPSGEFRKKFADQVYEIPDFIKDELETLPPQLVNWFEKTNFADMKAEDKQQAIRDYFAFCAMGDHLIGLSVANFKEFSRKQGRDYLILYVIGDHGWHLGEQGGESKFAPYDTSNHCAVIAVSSDKETWPAGQVSDSFVEFVDLAPTLLRAGGAELGDPAYQHLDGLPMDEIFTSKVSRDYVIGEMNHVIGPRCYLRSKDFGFSMRHREKNGKPGEKWGQPPGHDIQWGLTAPIESVELALFDLRNDPMEQNNVADDPAYRKLAEWFRKKLGRIVLGDNRLEADWSQKESFQITNFAAGAHDHKLEIPAGLIPVL
ncbi:sulfatase-like hydrolase/transferase [Roseibacillus persicicus]|uniref:sulfatase-like hydrolase/transferase n=1 Tax=Roseibacillus persicicus TaxID=454148 RepID=UPI00398AB565